MQTGSSSAAHAPERSQRPRLVAVVSSLAEWQQAIRLRRMPDLFELRLDALVSHVEHLQRMVGELGAPLIITARHPAEGGANNLTPQRRAALLLRFLPHAAYVDVELRSAARLQPVLDAANKLSVQLIVSVHDFRTTPTIARMQQLAKRAEEHGAAIFKLATRTDTSVQLARLLGFFEQSQSSIPISAMGIGELGRVARVALLREGSALNYAHLGQTRVDGQFSLRELRGKFAALPPPRARGAIPQRKARV